MADTKYTVLVGCNYPPDNTRAEPGDTITVPDAVAKALTKAGAVELATVTAAREKAAAKAAQAEADRLAKAAAGGSSSAEGGSDD